MVTIRYSWQRALLAIGLALALGACASGPQVTRIQEVPESAATPYKKILVITLLTSFDSRRYLEDEVVKHLTKTGTATVAVAGTSMMNTKTPLNRATLIAIVDEIGADAVLVTQISSLESEGTVVDMRPETTVNFRPTYYYNVWSVETTEYLEPQGMAFEHQLVLVSELFAVETQKPVWAIESKSRIVRDHETTADYTVFVDEANAIVTHLSRDGLIAR